MADQPSEYAVVIRRGPTCIDANTQNLLPRTVTSSLEEAERERAWYQQQLMCGDFPKYIKDCRYVVVELREVS